ncbi:MAG: Nif3-like dinuclear metal center hexameric protein [Duncaniella sp.]|nr:Nif3-like dinuclear metal center hexameric protein [Duncaniella sp.]
MTPSLNEIINALEAEVNPGLQESWDNTGWQVCPSSKGDTCKGVLVCVDVTDAVITEAVEKGCNLIISHHPLIFRPLKRLTGTTPAERMAIRLIKSGISVYSAHTSLDNASAGVSHYLAEALGLTEIEPLAPRRDVLYKVAVYVPEKEADEVRNAMHDAGAGHIGNYDRCGFTINGAGSFRPLQGSNPHIGQKDEITFVSEVKIEAVVPAHLKAKVESAIRKVHPYEEPAIDIYHIEAADTSTGLGAIGNLLQPLSASEIIGRVKEVYGSPMVRTTPHVDSMPVTRVALCGGSGGEFIPAAIGAGAQVYITSDVRYHDFVDYRDRILVVDTGHYESEKCTTILLSRIISKKFPNFAVGISASETNSITYQ